MDELLQKLYRATIEKLLERIENGDFTAADLAVARNFLKDNNIQALPEAAPDLVRLANILPFKQVDGGAEEAA